MTSSSRTGAPSAPAPGPGPVAPTGVPGWLLDETATVPDHTAFAGVDALVAGLREVAERHPHLARLDRIGSSRQGEPLWCLTVDDPAAPTAPEALVFGLPHPNEPIGGLTAVHLAGRLCADPALRARCGHRWRIVACIDPDGLRLNEGWLAGPFTRAHYARHFYRPAGHDQVEWTFPLAYRDAWFDDCLPETRALVHLMDRYRPRLVAPLHNSELGGAYYYLNREEPDLYPVLTGVPGHLGIPLDRGEPEAQHFRLLDTAVYLTPRYQDLYDEREARGEPLVQHGGSAVGYATDLGALAVISELPYWFDPAAGCADPTGTPYAEALARDAHELGGLADLMLATLARVEGHLVAPEGPFWRATRFFAPFLKAEADAAAARARTVPAGRLATTAELSSLTGHVHETRLRFAGMLLRALQGERAVGNVRGPVRAALAELAPRYEGWVEADAADLQLEPVPVRRLVGVQHAATLAAAAHLNGSLHGA